MWAYDFSRQTDLPPDLLWLPLADVANWSMIDAQIEAIQINQPPSVGTEFKLKRKGGYWHRRKIATFYPPSRYSDECELPFAKLRTTYSFHRRSAGSDIIVRIEIFGPFAAFWGAMMGRKLASGLHDHAARLIGCAREKKPRSVVPIPHLATIADRPVVNK